jgi:hypothetical protein
LACVIAFYFIFKFGCDIATALFSHFELGCKSCENLVPLILIIIIIIMRCCFGIGHREPAHNPPPPHRPMYAPLPRNARSCHNRRACLVLHCPLYLYLLDSFFCAFCLLLSLLQRRRSCGFRFLDA